MCAGVVPAEELLGCGFILSGIEGLEQGGGSEAALTEIETEVDEGVELALGEGHLDEALDGELGIAEIAEEDFSGLGLVDAVGERLGMEQAVAVADGGKSGDVEIGMGAKTL